MVTNTSRALIVLAMLAFAGATAAQSTRDSGTARGADGNRPADGAITGGSIVPGETGGVPSVGRSDNSPERLKRCNELTGTLRQQCLEQERSSTGASIPGTAPGGADVKAPGPRIDPPPQNPR